MGGGPVKTNTFSTICFMTKANGNKRLQIIDQQPSRSSLLSTQNVEFSIIS